MTPEMATGRPTAPVAHGGAGGQGEQLSALKRGKQSASQSNRKHTSRGRGRSVQAAGGRRCRHNLAGGQRSAASFPAAPNAAERT